ncbi:MAG TPA: ATP-binding cassette domain-containing protein, partial [Usitatibacter sp.]|nr:ATP-binding cassette domain-containing protein [Usitatibacter sp.]
TGGLTRDIERGTRGISTLLSFMVFSVLPTLLEIALVTGFLVYRFDIWFGVITVAALVLYVALTFVISEWRTVHRRRMNEMDSKANTRAIDSLLNYETVKYFGNEGYEAQRYDVNLKSYEHAVVTSETSLGLLNAVQAGVIALAVSLLMWRAAEGIVNGHLTLGDLVMVNALLIQLYIPLNFLGVMYREIKQATVDMEKMFRLLGENREIEDKPGAAPLRMSGGAIRFDHVDFSYDGVRPILKDVSFEVPAGRKVAVVGPSGSGKSTLARLLFRFYDVNAGRISIDGQDLRDVKQASVRAALGVVPQDTVLFNDTIYYNIAYGRPDATREEIENAARVAHIADFIARLPEGWETTVGERGLKLSGGEKQRVSIARTVLKHPPILVFDEATSALDARSERAIQAELERLARTRTTLVIALAVSLLMWRASEGIVNGHLTLGDLVMVNALLIQLYIPLNFLGVMYREIKQASVDMEKMFRLLGENREIEDKPGAAALRMSGGAIRFDHVDFSYDGVRPILKDVSFEVPAGRKVAVVGPSGSGKSTLARLLFRFYDVNAGRISIDGQDLRDVKQ